jgi:hypothetical protein
MKKRILLFSLTLGMIYTISSSRTGGVATILGSNLTGSMGSPGASCGGSGCHAAGVASTTATLVIQAVGASAPVLNGKYEAGKTYNVTLSGTNTLYPTPSLTKFGFQVTATKDDGTKAGTIVTPLPTNTATKTVAGREIFEQTAALSQGTIPNTYSVTYKWTAPPTGSGKVTFYYILNAVNGNGSENGDLPSTGKTSIFNEAGTSINEVNNNIASKIFPNPCSNILNIEAASNAKYVATVYDLAGRQVLAASHQNTIDVSSLSAGVYLLRLNTEGAQQTTTFIKQ